MSRTFYKQKTKNPPPKWMKEKAEKRLQREEKRQQNLYEYRKEKDAP